MPGIKKNIDGNFALSTLCLVRDLCVNWVFIAEVEGFCMIMILRMIVKSGIRTYNIQYYRKSKELTMTNYRKMVKISNIYLMMIFF
jgi:hypothetical protein